MTTKISTDNIQASALTALSPVKVSNVAISNSTYYVLDDTAVNVSGGYIVVTGSGFVDGATVLIEGTQASAVAFVDSTELHVQVPAKSAATYNLYVVNPDGSTAIRVNGLTYSGTPTWVTASPLDNQAVDVAFNLNFDATGATSYSNTSALPAGTSLLSNGYFYGTVTGIVEETTYNFTIQATDAENQDSAKTFSVTVTVGPPPNYLYRFGSGASSPVQIGTAEWGTLPDNSSDTSHLLLIKPNGTLWALGTNSGGELGLDDTINRNSPTQVGSGTYWTNKIALGASCSGAIRTDGTLWTWGNPGNSTFGSRLGLNQLVAKSSPTQVGTDTWNDISMSNFHGGAIKSDGTLWMWGEQQAGVLGLGIAVFADQSKSSPTQVGTDTNWSLINTKYYCTFAIKTNGTLWGWGSTTGGLGLGDVSAKSSPVQIGTSTWSLITMNGQADVKSAIKTDGTLWVWGGNQYGELGLNDTINKSSPTQVGTGTWSFAIGGFKIKSDGTLWTSGYNNAPYGALGLNDTINRSSPTQVGTDSGWNSAGGVINIEQNYATKSS